jgi:predicted DNA-binding transcriptional regulator YafY
VPIYAERGRSGGFALLEGWRTKLTGLTLPEAEAVLLAGLPGPAAALGIGEAMAAARLKLLASLPEGWRRSAERVAARFHLDATPWYRAAEPEALLPELARAVWAERRIHIRYESWTGVVDRRLDPLGLVLKGGTWYLVARAGRDLRTYRVSNVREAVVTEEGFARPARFDLARHWAEAAQRFEASLRRETATVRVTARGREVMRQCGGAAEGEAAAAAQPDGKGSWRVALPIEGIEQATRQVLALGPEAEVLAPPALRQAMAETTAALARIYWVGAEPDQAL